ncbi:hypothetical protein DHW03_06335 [Pedobacter yonginense]|uniref:PKD domain-containing protein n=1 Tax=Pedobacter yonginense TaxID=651869 RepID=A0A317EUD1_9SPHI|nr:PKD domain-containing protein [Pedobacter yonginense]PWS29429.1 hypothetical protein DHW03_06335 [Pedobacter yonginense]
MNKVLIFIFILFVSITTRVFGQNISNEGTDFWAVFPTHVPNSPSTLANLAVFVTSKFDTEVTVSCGTYTATKAIPANTAVQFDVDRNAAYISLGEANINLINRGIHIKVTDGKPKVSAYTHIYAGARSAASLILPFETLGQTYYSMNYTQSTGGNNFLALVAAEANTTLLIHEKTGTVKTITLANAGDVYEYVGTGNADLTGVYVESDPATSSCKRFAAFSGTSVVMIACTGSQDPLYQQLYPTVSWGRNYGVVPFIDRRYILRILAQDDNTIVNFAGQTITLKKGEFYESTILVEPTFITSDKLISVAQYSLTQGCSSVNGTNLIGDPEMVILNPIEFNIKAVTVFSSSLQAIAVRYLNILIRANKTGTFKINGVAPVVAWKPLTSNPTYAYAQIPVSSNSLTLTADEGFNAIAYGFGQAESYSYSAGTNLSSNNYLTVVNEAKKEEYPNGCIGTEVDFKINLPYQPDKITWSLDGEPDVITLNPVPEVKTTNGQKTYIYRYPANKTYTITGEYHLGVVAHVPNNASNCVSGDLVTNYVFTIYDLPTAKFTVSPTSCAKSDVTFTDQSTSNNPDFGITNWFWDFGDGKTSTEQNPKHQYDEEGDYNVTLSVKSGTGCYSDPTPVTVVSIYPLPVSAFSAPAISCINTDVLITDQSTISSAKTPNTIINWHWDFGDGTPPVDQTTPAAFAHQYATPGTYTISLTTTSARDCVSNVVSASITITNLPSADFSIPDICLNDAFALFVNKSVDATGGNGAFTYKWTFGDAVNSTPSNPNTSTTKDGKHNYSVAGTYKVTLEISNANGCISTKNQDFTVNGAVENAEFTIQNEANLCSSADVVINNTSNAFFGKITKIYIYKDFLNAPGDFITINYPTSDDIRLSYPSFGGLTDKKYTIRLVAYSGETCFKIKDAEITIKPTPQLEFTELASVCQADGDVIINQARETSGILGKGVYTGEGIDATGKFDPKKVNIGTHTITYTFTADNGCPASISQTIVVYKSPRANAGFTTYILSGGETTIQASAEGDNLTYKWTPALGLSSDRVLNPVASPVKDTEYTLVVSTDQGCTATSTITIKVLQALTPPNSFSPNGDNINDVWNIQYLDSYPNATVEIFNRLGTRVFFSNGYKIPFDGNFQNVSLPVGVYYFVINPRNGRKSVTGPLTIIR